MRFAGECRSILELMENCFEGLAKCQHFLEIDGMTDESTGSIFFGIHHNSLPVHITCQNMSKQPLRVESMIKEAKDKTRDPCPSCTETVP